MKVWSTLCLSIEQYTLDTPSVKLLIKKGLDWKEAENTVNNKPEFTFNIYSVIPFEGSPSLNSFSSLEKCMSPSSLIFFAFIARSRFLRRQ